MYFQVMIHQKVTTIGLSGPGRLCSLNNNEASQLVIYPHPVRNGRVSHLNKVPVRNWIGAVEMLE